MLGILFKAQVKADKRQAFIAFIKWDIQVAKEREPGTLRFDLYQDPADENAFFVYEAYLDKKAFEEHKKNLPYQRWESQIRPEVVADFQPLFDGLVSSIGAARHTSTSGRRPRSHSWCGQGYGWRQSALYRSHHGRVESGDLERDLPLSRTRPDPKRQPSRKVPQPWFSATSSTPTRCLSRTRSFR
jgi:quinol monooxygenase YgiN